MHCRLALSFALLGPVAAVAQPSRDPGPPVPVVTAPVQPETPAPLPAEQRLYQPAMTLVPPEQAAQVVEEFRAAYERLGRPRLVVYVNRELVEDRGGLHLTSRRERVETDRQKRSSTHAAPPAGQTPETQVNVAVHGAAGAGAGEGVGYGPGESTDRRERVTAENEYARTDAPETPLADRQTVRDVERLFGRPLRLAGAQLADQRVIAGLIEDRPLETVLSESGSESARKDREALTRVADAVVEVLISSRSLTVPGLQADETHQVPDIQATLIRLSDGAILGQASASDVLGRDRYAGPIIRNFETRDIAEATALALMEDISVTAPDQP